MKKITNGLIVSLLVLLSIVSCSSQQVSTIRLPVGFIPNVQFAPIYVAIEKGFYQEEDLEIEMDYNMETDSVALVGAGETPFAVVSGEQVLLGRAQELPVVYVMAWYEDYPVGVVAKKGQGLKEPQDLAGKSIGIPGLYGTSYIGMIALLNAGGLTEEDVDLQSIGYTQVESLANDVVDMVNIYINNEPIKLEAEGYDLDVLMVSDYLSLVANGLITNEEVIETQPELVNRMVRATLRGIQYAAENPDEAFEICMKYVDNLSDLSDEDLAVQRQVLQKSIEIWQLDDPGYTDPQAWEHMQDLLLQMGLIEEPQNLTNAYSNAFIGE